MILGVEDPSKLVALNTNGNAPSVAPTNGTTLLVLQSIGAPDPAGGGGLTPTRSPGGIPLSRFNTDMSIPSQPVVPVEENEPANGARDTTEPVPG